MIIKELHLAAFMKANGATFVEYTKSGFSFLSDISETEWRMRHSNSCCRKVDSELINLRKFLQRK